MRVIFLLWSTHIGGAETFVVRLSMELRRRRSIDARVAAMTEAGGVAELARALGVPVEHLNAQGGLRFVAQWASLRRRITEMQPDVVVPLGYDLNLPPLVLPRPIAHVVVREPGGDLLNPNTLGSRLRRHKPKVIRAALSARVSAEVCVSQYMLRVQMTLPHAKRICCIPNGVDTSSFFPRPDWLQCRSNHECFTVLAAGRLTPEKGFGTLLEASRLLAQQRDVPVLLRIAGAGTDEAGLGAVLLGGAGGSVRVELLRDVVDMPAFWRTGDVAVVPSSSRCRESFGLVAAEALACGLPVVATQVGALPEVVRHGQTGLLVPPDNPPAMAGALAAYYDSEELRMRHAVAARRRAVSEYSLERTADAYADLFQEVSAKPTGPSH